jgi:hypothetical protein
MYLLEYLSNVTKFLIEIIPQNSGTNPTGFMPIGVL